MSYFSILSDGTSLPPSSPPAYDATADSPAPPAMDVDSPPPVPISSPSPEWPATPETELDFDHDLNENLAHQNNLDHISLIETALPTVSLMLPDLPPVLPLAQDVAKLGPFSASLSIVATTVERSHRTYRTKSSLAADAVNR
ncbi:hypothetical protein RhiLY_03442 [Ceratobasidium sp. AG-Ba]|nr:hypothetical protein RhiLY_03442 [Ceratobasidium sp. AG-Ba]